MRELFSNNSLFVGQLYEDKSLALRARDLIIITQQFTAGADLFLKYMQLASGFMQLAVAGHIGATKYIFAVFLKENVNSALEWG